MKKFIAILLILSQPAFADQALPIKLGNPAPFDGTILDKEKAEKVKDQLIDADACKLENDSFQKSVDLYKNNQVIYNQENSLLLGRNVELSKALSEAKETSDWTKIGYFALGIIVVSAGVYGASRLGK